jgi:hypothetical protein
MKRFLILLGMLGALGSAYSAAHAQHAGDMLLASTASGGGALTIEYDFDTVVGLDYDPTLSGTLGLSAYTATDPGFDALEADEPGEGLFRVADGTDVTVEITSLDEGRVAMLLNGMLLDAPGESVLIGTQPDLHHHPELRLLLMLPADQPGEGTVCFRLTTASAAYTDSGSFCMKLSNTHLFVDFAEGEVVDNVRCQKAIGRSARKYLTAVAKNLYKCLDTVGVVVANEEAGLPAESAEAVAAKACGDDGGSKPTQATMLGKIAKQFSKSRDDVAANCGATFDADRVARHLNQAACNVQSIAAQGYPEAHAVLAGITQGGSPVSDALPCLFRTQAGAHED